MKTRSTGSHWWLAAMGVGTAGLALHSVLKSRRYLDLQGKTVLITGGSRGLGFVLAQEFARHGARVAICARNQEELSRAHDLLLEHGIDALTIVCDVTHQAEVDRMISTLTAQLGRIDVLVNNVGTITVAPMEEMNIADYEEAMAAHFFAPLYTTLAVLPQMRQRRAGRIVNISSIGGRIAVPHLLPYSASKFALAGLSEGLRAELLKDRIYVTTVFPGLLRTGSPRNANFKGKNQQEFAWFSIGDSLPGTSISADSAAARIVAATARGEAEVVLSTVAKVAIKAHGLFPGFVADINGMLARLLPGPGGGRGAKKGYQSQSALSPSIATLLGDKAAAKLNQFRSDTPPTPGEQPL